MEITLHNGCTDSIPHLHGMILLCRNHHFHWLACGGSVRRHFLVKAKQSDQGSKWKQDLRSSSEKILHSELLSWHGRTRRVMVWCVLRWNPVSGFCGGNSSSGTAAGKHRHCSRRPEAEDSCSQLCQSILMLFCVTHFQVVGRILTGLVRRQNPG